MAASIKNQADLFYADLMGDVVRARGGGAASAVLEDAETTSPTPRPKPGALFPAAIASQPAFQILSPLRKPLPNLRWAVHQQQAVFTGALDPQGWTGPIDRRGKFDPAQPFRLHIDGCVCVIDSGAQLLVHEPDVEYGGQFIDWTHADDQDSRKRDAFWQAYAKARQIRGPREVFRFIQHDHVMRRPVKLLTRQTRAVFEAWPLAIRVGPLVRFVDTQRALIWLELETPGLVRITYGKAGNQRQLPGAKDVPATTSQRYASTVRVGGRHFALIALEGLEANTVYQYSITLAPQPASGPLPAAQTEFTDGVFPKQPLYGGTPVADLSSVSFSGSEWLFFRTLEATFTALRFAHGSCRKWPGDIGQPPAASLGDTCKRWQGTPGKVLTPSPDMLERFGSHWLAKKEWSEWPRFFLHTGDQIYADDIGVNMGTAIVQQRFASVTPGPAGSAGDVSAGAWAGRFAPRYSPRDVPKTPSFTNLDEFCKLRPSVSGNKKHDVDFAIRRAVAARRQAAFLSSRPPLPLPFTQRVANELLWAFPDIEAEVPFIDKVNGLRARQRYELPRQPGRDFRIEYPSAGETGGVHAADFAEYAALYEQAWGSQASRRVLAHLPSFMIFDDHEVTDDWNSDPGWLEMVHSDKDRLRYWPHTITDALCAYWMYQGWGNLAPERWADDPRVKILDECRKQGRDALPELRRLVLTRSVEKTAPKVKPDDKLDWHFELPTGSVPFVAVDLRTDREVNGSGGLSKARLDWLEQKLTTTRSPVAIVVLPVPFLMPDPLLFVFRHLDLTTVVSRSRSSLALQRGSDIEHPAGNLVWVQIRDLIAKLQGSSSALKTVVIISGDVHFSCNFDGQLKGSKRKAPRLLQLISSGLQQQVSKEKQGQLFGAYKGGFSVLTQSKGVDEHRGIRITIGGMKRSGATPINFLFDTSVAVVDVQLLPAGGDSRRGFMPLIKQLHLVHESGPTLAAWEFQHRTESDGRGALTVNDPGISIGPVRAYPTPSAGPDRTAVIEVAEPAGDVVLVEASAEDVEDVGEALDINDARRKTFREMWDLMAKYHWRDTPALFTNELMLAICWEESTFMNIWQQGKGGTKGPAKGFGQLEPSAFDAIRRKFGLKKTVAELQELTDADAFAVSFIGRALHTLHDNMLAQNPKQANEPEKLKRRVLLYGYGGYAYDHAEWRIKAIDGWYAFEQALLAGKGASGYPTRTAAMQALDVGMPPKRKFPEPLWTTFREKLCATLPDP